MVAFLASSLLHTAGKWPNSPLQANACIALSAAASAFIAPASAAVVSPAAAAVCSPAVVVAP